MEIETAIKKIDSDHIAVITTTVDERLIAKVTLDAQRVAKLQEIADIDAMLAEFEPK